MRIRSLVLGFGVLALSVACGDKVETVEVKPNKISIVLPFDKPEVTLTASPKTKEGKDVEGQQVAWKSSDDKVAAVAAGKVTAKGPGSAKIEAAVGEKKGEATIEVKKVSAIKFKEGNEQQTLKVGDSLSLTATFADDKGADVVVAKAPAIEWASADATIATVENGAIKAVKEGGPVKITAKAGELVGEVSVTVTAAAPAADADAGVADAGAAPAAGK